LAGNNKSALKVTGPGDHGDLQWYGNMASQASQMDKSRVSNYQHLHFCLHFVRDFSLNGRQVYAVQQKIYGDAHRLRYLLKSQTKYYGKPHRAKRTPLEVDARALIRGFDVAGNENELPIHVFAPALRFLRDKSTNITLLNGKPKLFKARYLSIHAGEDFSHLISGLRHIDETVYYCNMGKGDRIGHGLALGVMPNEWAKRQCQAFVGCEEYLWNTVWLLHYAKILKREKLIGVLEERLKSWQNRFLGELQSFELLWAYWQCRGNSYLHEKRTHHCETLKDRKYWVLNKVEDDWRKPFAQIRFKLQLLQRQKPQYITVNFLSTLENMLGKTSSDNMVEFIKPTELEFYQQLQDYLMVKYSESGLSIEVCPSSNISLGRFEQYYQHPIFRWHPPSEKMYEKYGFDQFKLRNEMAVSVCINTDDPGIFPTKIEQEYVLLKNAAMQFDDVTENIASEWIEGIRRNSLAIFEQSHDKTNLFSSPNADFAQAQQPSRSR
jgi:adenosine deaminase